MNPRKKELLESLGLRKELLDKLETHNYNRKEEREASNLILHGFVKLRETEYKSEDSDLLLEALRDTTPDYCEHGRSTSGVCGRCDWVVNDDGKSVENDDEDPNFIPTNNCAKCAAGLRLSPSQVEDVPLEHIKCSGCSEY